MKKMVQHTAKLAIADQYEVRYDLSNVDMFHDIENHSQSFEWYYVSVSLYDILNVISRTFQFSSQNDGERYNCDREAV